MGGAFGASRGYYVLAHCAPPQTFIAVSNLGLEMVKEGGQVLDTHFALAGGKTSTVIFEQPIF